MTDRPITFTEETRLGLAPAAMAVRELRVLYRMTQAGVPGVLTDDERAALGELVCACVRPAGVDVVMDIIDRKGGE